MFIREIVFSLLSSIQVDFDIDLSAADVAKERLEWNSKKAGEPDCSSC